MGLERGSQGGLDGGEFLFGDFVMGDGERLLISVSLFHEDAGVGMVVDFLGAGDVKRSLFPVHLIILMK